MWQVSDKLRPQNAKDPLPEVNMEKLVSGSPARAFPFIIAMVVGFDYRLASRRDHKSSENDLSPPSNCPHSTDCD